MLGNLGSHRFRDNGSEVKCWLEETESYILFEPVQSDKRILALRLQNPKTSHWSHGSNFLIGDKPEPLVEREIERAPLIYELRRSREVINCSNPTPR